MLVREGIALTVALLLAETFFRFHSFALECLAFLGAWTALSAILEGAATALAWLGVGRPGPRDSKT